MSFATNRCGTDAFPLELGLSERLRGVPRRLSMTLTANKCTFESNRKAHGSEVGISWPTVSFFVFRRPAPIRPLWSDLYLC